MESKILFSYGVSEIFKIQGGKRRKKKKANPRHATNTQSIFLDWWPLVYMSANSGAINWSSPLCKSTFLLHSF